jgi:hypothetical protein
MDHPGVPRLAVFWLSPRTSRSQHVDGVFGTDTAAAPPPASYTATPGRCATARSCTSCCPPGCAVRNWSPSTSTNWPPGPRTGCGLRRRRRSATPGARAAPAATFSCPPTPALRITLSTSGPQTLTRRRPRCSCPPGRSARAAPTGASRPARSTPSASRSAVGTTPSTPTRAGTSARASARSTPHLRVHPRGRHRQRRLRAAAPPRPPVPALHQPVHQPA